MMKAVIAAEGGHADVIPKRLMYSHMKTPDVGSWGDMAASRTTGCANDVGIV